MCHEREELTEKTKREEMEDEKRKAEKRRERKSRGDVDIYMRW